MSARAMMMMRRMVRRQAMMPVMLVLWILLSSTPTFASENQFLGSFFLPRDVAYDNTARKALQQVRRNKHEDVSAVLSSCGNDNQATMTMVGYKGGRIHDQINQDRSFCISPYHVDGYTNASQLLAVFDGHGTRGEEVAQYALDELPKRLGHKLSLIFSNEKDSVDNAVKQALVDTFLEIDRSIPTHGQGGCTASVVLQLGSKVYIANAGDSTSLIAIYNKAIDATRVVYKSRDDKPDLPDEYNRIVKMGGTVNIPKDTREDTPRVLYTYPETGYQMGLAMSRSIGDWDMVGVIAEPIVDMVDLRDIVTINTNDETCTTNEKCQATTDSVSNDVNVFAVSATDGMMDYLSPQEVATRIARAFYHPDGPHPLIAIDDAILQAAKGWNLDMDGEYRDDIAIVASKLDTDSLAAKFMRTKNKQVLL